MRVAMPLFTGLQGFHTDKFNFIVFLDAFAKSRKATISFVMSVQLSVRME